MKNPNVGTPNEREIDLIIILQESTYQQQNNISSQRKYLTTPNLSHRNLSRFSCQNCIAVRPPRSGLEVELAARVFHPQYIIVNRLYEPAVHEIERGATRGRLPGLDAG